MASMLLFVLAAQFFGLAFGAESAATNDSMNATQMNETLENATHANETLDNETLENLTLSNETLENETIASNDSDSNPFTNARNRKPSGR